MRGASQHRCGVFRIRAAVPKQQRPRNVTLGCRYFPCQYPTANRQAGCGIAQGPKRRTGKSVLARHLPHHLHQAPGKRSRTSLAFIGDCAACKLRLHVAHVESGLIAQRPVVPGRLLLDDGADQFGPKRLCTCGLACQCHKFRGSRCAGCATNECCWRVVCHAGSRPVCRFVWRPSEPRTNAKNAACAVVVPTQFHKSDGRRLGKSDAVLLGDQLQRLVNVR